MLVFRLSMLNGHSDLPTSIGAAPNSAVAGGATNAWLETNAPLPWPVHSSDNIINNGRGDLNAEHLLLWIRGVK